MGLLPAASRVAEVGMGLLPAASLVAEIGVDGETAAAAKLASFGGVVDKTAEKQVAGSQKIGAAFSKLDSSLGQFGVPFTGALGVVGSKLEQTSSKGTSALQELSAGGTAAALGFGAVSVEAIHLADAFDVAHGRLVTATADVGQSFSSVQGSVKATDDKLVNLGFTSATTESSLAKLTTATKDSTTAQGLMGLAADIARGRNQSLASATDILVKVETDHVSLLGRLGINTKDATGKTITQTEAIQRLTDLYGGQASAYLDTYAGKTDVLKAKADETAVTLGTVEKDALRHVADATYDGVTAFQSFNSTLDGVPGKVLAVTAGLGLATLVGAKVVTTVRSITSALGIGAAATDTQTVASVALTAAEDAETTATAAAAEARTSLLTLPAAANELDVAAATEAAATAETQLAAATEAANVAREASIGTTAVESASMLALLGPIGLVVGGITAGALALNHFFGGDNSDSKIKGLAADLLKVGDAAKTAALQLDKTVGPDATLALQEYSDQLLAGASASDLAKTKAVALAAATEHNNGLFSDAHDKIDTATKSLQDNAKELGASGVQTAALSAAQKQYADDLASGHASDTQLASDRQNVITLAGQQAGVQDQVNSATQQGTAAANDATTAAQKQADALTALDNRLKALNDDTLASANSELALQQSNIDVGNAADTYRAKLVLLAGAKKGDAQAARDASSAGVALNQAVLDGIGKAEDAGKAQFDLTSKLSGTAKAIGEETAKHQAAEVEIAKLKQQYPELSGLIDNYAKQLGLIPTSINTTVTINGRTASAGITNGSYSLPDTTPKGHHASGGVVRPGELTTLGEQGTELGYLRPDGSGMDILSNPQTRHVLGGGGGGTDRELLDKFDQLFQILTMTRPPQVIANTDPAAVAREIAAQQRRQFMLTNF